MCRAGKVIRDHLLQKPSMQIPSRQSFDDSQRAGLAGGGGERAGVEVSGGSGAGSALAGYKVVTSTRVGT